MLINPDPGEIQTIARLSLSEFSPLIGYLQKELAATDDALENVEVAERLRQLQGKARFIREFIKLVAKARDMI